MLELFPACRPDHRKSLQLPVRCLWRRHRKGAKEAITLKRAALELCSTDHCYRAEILYNPVDNMRERFLKLDATADPNEAIALHRSALDPRPIGHSKWSCSLHALALSLWRWRRKQANISELEGAIALGRAALALRPPDHRHHVLALYNLALYLRQRLMEPRTNADLGEAIALSRSALYPCRTGHFDWLTPFNSLISRLSSRFKKLWAAADLDGLISFPCAVLDLQSLRHPDRVMSLRKWLRRLDTMEDFNECIPPKRAALALCDPGSPDHVKFFCNSNLRKRFQKVVAIITEEITLRRTVLEHPLGGPNHVVNLVMGTVNSTLEPLPSRLLNTHTGVLCDRNALRSAFWNTQKCKRLLSSVTTCPTTLRDNIDNTVSTYFEYVTLSHRWDKEDPLLHHIQGRVIYDMNPTAKGLKKLREFCTAARNCGYLWAWNDTCCVDRDAEEELRNAMASMFSWYRRSALTIVYLSDVSRDDTLSSSAWFKRGWTLQELLAPRKVLFYTQDWSLYKDSSSLNHKDDDAVLTELEATTDIARHYLTDFNPGFDNARSRLQWASGRETTEPEDLAYSLFGIFSVNLPFESGESAENALGRLLTKIISKSGDLSVLDWVGEASAYHSCFPAQIASYGNPLSGPPPASHENEPQTSLPNTSELVEARVKLLNSLSAFKHPRFNGKKLRLPCIVFQVTAVELEAMNIQTPKYVYNIQVEGLLPFKITLPHELKDTSRPLLPFVLIRPWHSKLLGSSIEARVSDKLDARLTQPFSALLLEEQAGNYYKRIASSSVIVARSADVASVFKGKPKTITVL